MASVVELTLTIYDGLQHPDAIRWAQDGRVALLTQSLVIVLQYPGEESEPFVRFEVPIRKQQKVVDAGTLLAEDMYKDSAAMSYAVSRTSDCGVVTLIYTAVDWSPLGCSWDGGCLLATLSSDSVLEVLAPPLSPRALQLESVCCVSDLWTAFVQSKGYSVSQDSTATSDSRRRRKGRKRGRQRRTISEGGNDMDSDGYEGGQSEEVGERAQVGGYVSLEEWVRRVDLLTIDAMAWAKQRWREEVDGRGVEHTLLAMGGRGRVLAFFAFTSKPLSHSRSSCCAVVPTPVALITCMDHDIFKLEWLAPEGSAISAAFPSTDGARAADNSTHRRTDHAILAMGSTYGSVELVRLVYGGGGAWDASRLRTICAPDLQPVVCMRFVWDLPDGGPPGALAVAKGASLMMWALPSGDAMARELEAHTHNIGGMDTCYGPDGQGPHVVTGSMDGTIKVWKYALAEGGRCSFELSPELSSMIPTTKDPLMGLAVSPNRLALALARVTPGSDTNERRQQLNRHLRKNHCCVALQPVFQDGWRSVVLPEDSDALLRLMGWKAMYEYSWAAVPAPPPVVDLIMVASLDFASMMEVQAHPDFLEEAGTTLGPDLVAVEKVEDVGEEKDQQGAEEEATVNGGDLDAAEEQKGQNGRRAKKAPGVTRKLKNMLVRVDVDGLPTSSHEILADTVFDRLRGLLWGCPVAHIDERDDAPPVRLLPIWQALHALCSHISDRHLSKQRPEHLMLTNTQILVMATTFITATYIDRSLGALFERIGTAEGAAAALPSEERQIALNMASWVELNKSSVEEQCAREGGTWEELVQMTLSVVGESSELVEQCVLCSAKVPFNDGRTAECERGHTLSRCMETLLVLESFEYWECPVCHSMAKCHVSPATGDGQDAVKATDLACSTVCDMESTLLRPPWLQPPRREGVWCLFCNMPCSLLNA